MADIAFLLLIFFLVTTTMDKDQAYLRQIPKPIIDQKPQPPVDERNVLAIKSNNRNQIQIRERIIEMDNISDEVLKFYQSNEKKIVNMEYPFYSRVSKSEIEAAIKNIDDQIDAFDQNPETPAEFYQVKDQERAGWVKKLNALALYGGALLPEISPQANIRIEVASTTQYEVFAKIHSEIEEAISELKDKESKRIFNTPYSVLKRKNSLDADGKAELDKLELLDLLYPSRIIEVTPKR